MFKFMFIAAIGGLCLLKTGLRAADIEYSIDTKGLPEITCMGTKIMNIKTLFFGAEWKWASFDMARTGEGFDEWRGHSKELAFDMAVKWSLDEKGGLTGKIDLNALKTISPAIGGGFEFSPVLKSPFFKGKDTDPVLIEKKGWEWKIGDDESIRVTFEPDLSSLYFERGSKGCIRCFLYSDAVPEGKKSYTMKIELPKDSRRIASFPERYGDADTSKWMKDVLNPTKSFIDLSYLNHRPAGKNGFIKVSGDKFVMGNGGDIRFWGANLQAYTLFMKDRELIKAHAKRMAEMGFNLVRLHHMDSQTWVKDCLIAEGPTSQEINKEALDTYFYWIKCLKDEGIYVWIDLHVGRPFRKGDDIPGFDELFAKRRSKGDGVEVKGYSYVNDRIKELMKNFNNKLMTTVNPHTGLALKDEPAVMGIMLTNENDLTCHHGNELLADKNVPYHNKLFNGIVAEFAKKTGLPKDKLIQTWLPGPSKILLNDMEYNWNVEMIDHLRRLGVKQPIDTCHIWGAEPLFSLPALTAGDMIDAHSYTNGEYLNSNPRGSANFADSIVRSQISGMPLAITEWNFEDNAPGRDEYVNILLISAMSAFQGWDAPMLFSYSQDRLSGKGVSSWSSHNYPNIIGLMPAAALIYREGHVSPAKQTFIAKLDRDSLFMKGSSEPEPAFRTLALLHRVAVALPEVKELPWLKASPIPEAATVFTDLDKDFIPANQTFTESDTGELRLDWKKGIFTVNTPKSQGFAGWAKGNRIDLKSSSFSITNPKAAVILTSLDGQPLENSRKMLLSTAARISREKMKWEMKVAAEPVTGSLSFKNSSSQAELSPLNGDGSEQQAVALEKKDGYFLVSLPENSNTLWYLIKAK